MKDVDPVVCFASHPLPIYIGRVGVTMEFRILQTHTTNFLIELDKVRNKIYFGTFTSHLDNAMIDIKSIIQLMTKIVLGMK